MKKALSLILTVVLLAGVATGCGSGGGQSGSTASAGSSVSEQQTKQQWGFIFEQLTNPNYVTMSGVALDYCKELGIELQIVDGGENSDTIVNAAENMATMGYQVILLSPMAVEIAATAAEAAKAISPDIIVVNSAIQCDSCDFTLLQDDYTSGYISGQYAGQYALDNGLKQALVLGYPRDKALIDREEGFIKGMEETAPEVEIVNVDMSNYGLDEFTGACENQMTAHPDCRIVYAISDVVMSYFYESLQASGQNTSDWALYSVDGTKDAVGWLYAEKGYRGTADTGTLEIPKGLIDAALELQEGTSASDISISLPVTMITGENVDEYAEKIGYEAE
ncbi:substrate-binding domain-containing protein [Anaerofilum sp. BX8]|uniref:Substrate-binding domain-containing protein n=1 Tax=Anaerofilum hominis TaxID=2763016 RepID=A0A923IA36_9FIRM|nr:substrate-binding domain-containing protein [Anaerofilum hominis]MBC5581894.1 substrate-binding domain-containing protein [Anaerofilum hominis]